MLLTLAIQGYRSIRDVVLPLERLNVVTGENGSGKSSLYRAINLLAATAQGRVASSLAAEGGLQSTLWAGPESFSRAMKRGEQAVQGVVRKGSVSLKLGFASQDYGYAIDLGLPEPDQTFFGLDPVIKTETVWAGEILRPSATLASRKGPSVSALQENGKRGAIRSDLAPFDSMMTHAASPQLTPELVELRERMRSWRFYDHFRTDRDAPARLPQIGTRTPVLSNSGADLAAALQTIVEIGDRHGLEEAIDDAFAGHAVEIRVNDGYFEINVHQKGLLRTLRANELSDGTLRYLLLVAALLTPRPPSLMVLNEPETSLHNDLLEPLARLIVKASESSQLIVVSHSRVLVDALRDAGGQCLKLHKELGETHIANVEKPHWSWPSR